MIQAAVALAHSPLIWVPAFVGIAVMAALFIQEKMR